MSKLLTSADFTDMPWKNGGGTTRELFRLPAEGEFDLRLSMARVGQSGPFSYFPGVDRVLMLLSGDGFALDLAGEPRRLDTPFAPLHFAGEQAVHCRLLGGECLDFNLMVRRDWGRASLRVHRRRAGEGFISEGAQARLCYEHGDAPRLWLLEPGEALTLAPADASWPLIEIELYPHSLDAHSLSESRHA
ncbi:HutD family protein [Oceanimonas sp. NS1]|nr:HutD family protein [Oceanimonas sp. NS1]